MNPTCAIHEGDCLDVLRGLPSESAHCCVTSPPYFQLRNYGHPGQIGLEKTPAEFIARLVAVFEEVRRVLRADGTCWVNMGDSYAACGGAHGGRDDNQTGVGAKRTHANGGGDKSARRAPNGCKPKDLIGIPWMLAFALREAGWYLRQDIIWHKPNPMPESVRDRCTKAHEYLFLLTKSERYFWDAEAMQEPASNPEGPGNVRHKHTDAYNGGDERNRTKAGLCEIGARDTRNKRSVWSVATQPFKEAHFATFPPDLIRPCVRAGCPVGGTVLDPFGGSGTTGKVALEEGRSAVLIELNPKYAEMATRRTSVTPGLPFGMPEEVLV